MARIFLTTVIVFLGLCSLTAAANAQLTQNQELQLFYNIFKDWSGKYNKQYGIEEMAVRFTNWKNNYHYVQDHNTKDSDTRLEMNHFGDLNTEEFSALHLGLRADVEAARRRHEARRKSHHEAARKAENHANHINHTQHCNDTNHTNHTNHTNNTNNTNHTNCTNHTNHTNNTNTTHYKNLPKSVDWRQAGAVTDVKNQGQCGACWSFSAAGALEGLHAIKNKRLESLSMQQMVDCAGDFGNQGCDGGLMSNAFNYTSQAGVQLLDDYPYLEFQNDCQYDPTQVAFKNTWFEEIPMNDTLALKAAVAQQPVSVGIEASSMTVQLFAGGVIKNNCGLGLDHGVLVVGYGVDRKGEDYWIVKNSWGPQWGLNGFFNIAMGHQNGGAGVCGINILASYPTLEQQHHK